VPDVSVSINAHQLVQLGIDMSKFGITAQIQSAAIVKRTAYQVEATAKQLCPVDTGFLRNSINTTYGAGGGEFAAEVKAGASYAMYVEYGTSRAAPQPFMGPALNAHTDEFEQAMYTNVFAGWP
jgi:HK97 gp10 family phage protein